MNREDRDDLILLLWFLGPVAIALGLLSLYLGMRGA